MREIRPAHLIAAAVLATTASSASAQLYLWQGPPGANWSDPSNWSIVGVGGVPPSPPTPGSNVNILSDVTLDLSVVSVGSIWLDGNGTDIFNNGTGVLNAENLGVAEGANATLQGLSGSGHVKFQTIAFPFEREYTLSFNFADWTHTSDPILGNVPIDLRNAELRLFNGSVFRADNADLRINTSSTQSYAQIVVSQGSVMDIDVDIRSTESRTRLTQGGGCFRRDAFLGPVTIESSTLCFGDDADPVQAAGSLEYEVDGSGIISVQQDYTLTMSGAKSFVGLLSVNGGTLVGTSGPSLGSLSNTISLAGGGTYAPRGTYSTAIPLELFGDGSVSVIETFSPHTLLDPLSGTGTLAKTGNGTLVLAGNGAGFTGDLRVEQGELRLPNTTVTGLDTDVWVAANASVEFVAPDTSVNTITGDGKAVLADRLFVTGAGTGIGVGAVPDFAGSLVSDISDHGAITVRAGGTHAFSGNNHGYNGTWTAFGMIEFAGPAAWTGDASIMHNGAIVVRGGGTTHSLLTGPNGSSLRKTGQNVFNFDGDGSAFMGTTDVEQGTLRVDGVLNGLLVLDPGTTLSGVSGSLLGPVFTSQTATITPGDGTDGSTGTLSFQQLEIGKQATLELNIGGIAPNTFDRLLVEDLQLFAPLLVLTVENGFMPQPHQTFEVLAATGSFGGGFPGAPSGSRLPTADGAGSFIVTYDNTSKTVVLSDFIAGDTGVACSMADLALPLGVLDADDVLEHLARAASGSGADVNGDGIYTFDDTIEFLAVYDQGCP